MKGLIVQARAFATRYRHLAERARSAVEAHHYKAAAAKTDAACDALSEAENAALRAERYARES